jgi:hypothetical protein
MKTERFQLRGNNSVCAEAFTLLRGSAPAQLRWNIVQGLRNLTSWPTFRDNLSVPSSKVKKSYLLDLEDGTDRLSRNVGTKLPFNVA